MPSSYVHKSITLLSQALDPFISKKLEPMLGGLEWTQVLSELDSMRGRSSWTYSRQDVALQLRMVTERLGGLGYPFDAGDSNRTFSSYGSVLRIVRKRWAHNDEFDVFDALSAVDTVRTVLVHIGDHESAQKAAGLRAELLSNVLAESESLGVEVDPNEKREIFKTSGEELEDGLYKIGYSPTGELPWEPWPIVLVGQQSELDNLRVQKTREKIRSLIEEITDAEGPLHQDRLVRLVGNSFGFTRISGDRVKRIKHQVAQADVEVDADGFVWPQGIDTSMWKLVRKSTIEQRNFEHVPTREVANALLLLSARRNLELDSDELVLETLAYYGRKNRTASAMTHLNLALGYARAHLN